MSQPVTNKQLRQRVRELCNSHVLTVCAVGAVMLILISCAGPSKEVVAEANKPSPQEFLLGPEDVIEITVWRNQDLSRTVVVRPDGMISLPLIGDVQASGLVASQVAEKIAKRLSEFKENPTVSVSVKEVNSYFIYAVGEVTKPGKYPLKSYATVLQGISLAGGFTPYASRDSMVVIRKIKSGEVRIPVPFTKLTEGKGEISNFTLLSGDTIVVP